MPRPRHFLTTAEKDALALVLRRLDFLEPANALVMQGLTDDEALIGAYVQYVQAYPEPEG